MVDKDDLRRLALAAQSDESDPTVRVAYTPAEYALATMLDPATVLALLDEAKTERASFEAACDAADEFDARLERLAHGWVDKAKEAMGRGYPTSAYDRCAGELLKLISERR